MTREVLEPRLQTSLSARVGPLKTSIRGFVIVHCETGTVSDCSCIVFAARALCGPVESLEQRGRAINTEYNRDRDQQFNLA